MQALSRVSTLQPAISLLEKTPPMLELLLRDLPEELLDWKPGAERWSVHEVLAHLLLIEQLYGDRAKRILVNDNPLLTKFVPPEEAELRKRTAHQHLGDFIAARRAHIFFWHSVPANAGARTAVHPEMGQITLHQMLNELANHDLGHLRQIAEIYRAKAFYPHAGPFQRYSSPKP
jgi:uncharacterized damage-inducible protein DinB